MDWVKAGQLAFLKLVKDRLAGGLGAVACGRLMRMGRWSDERAWIVDQETEVARLGEQREMSGEEACPEVGTRV